MTPVRRARQEQSGDFFINTLFMIERVEWGAEVIRRFRRFTQMKDQSLDARIINKQMKSAYFWSKSASICEICG
jgi:hypothetical protein